MERTYLSPNEIPEYAFEESAKKTAVLKGISPDDADAMFRIRESVRRDELDPFVDVSAFRNRMENLFPDSVDIRYFPLPSRGGEFLVRVSMTTRFEDENGYTARDGGMSTTVEFFPSENTYSLPGIPKLSLEEMGSELLRLFSSRHDFGKDIPNTGIEIEKTTKTKETL